MRAALLQTTASDDPAETLPRTLSMIEEAVASGADFVLTPEVTNCISASRTKQTEVLQLQNDDQTLAALRNAAARHGRWLLIGSLALKTNDDQGRFANRSFLIDPIGAIVASYDKMHMFDVKVSDTETYRESAGYRPGESAVVADTPVGRIGMTICYDLRFPYLYRELAQSGAQILTVPSAFSPTTGAAHWDVLLRARAIETGCYVLAPAQTGRHPTSRGRQRETYGHSLAVTPWGDVIADAGTETGVTLVDLDLDAVSQARAQIPSLTHDRVFEAPQ